MFMAYSRYYCPLENSRYVKCMYVCRVCVCVHVHVQETNLRLQSCRHSLPAVTVVTFWKLQRKQNFAQIRIVYTHTHAQEVQLKSKSNTLEPAHTQHERLTTYVIATFVPLCFHFHKEKFSASFKNGIVSVFLPS